DVLLPAWAEAHLAGSPDAKVHVEHARLIGDALLRTTTDAMPRDAARALVEPEASATSRDPLRSQAVGHQTLREAKRLYDPPEPPGGGFSGAQRGLTEGGSPYGPWAERQMVAACLFRSEQAKAMSVLARLEKVAEAHDYLRLAGYVRWPEAVIAGGRGDLVASLSGYRSALASLH